MRITLTPLRYFGQTIFYPLDKRLTNTQKAIGLIGSVLLFGCTLGLGHLFCHTLFSKKAKKLDANDPNLPLSSKKTQRAAHKKLRSPSTGNSGAAQGGPHKPRQHRDQPWRPSSSSTPVAHHPASFVSDAAGAVSAAAVPAVKEAPKYKPEKLADIWARMGEDIKKGTTFIQYFLGGTSDHTWRTWDVSFTEPSKTEPSKNETLEVSVGTWNLMDRGTKKGGIREIKKVPGKPDEIITNDYGNNPLDHEEDDAEYATRKEAQIKELETLMKGEKKDFWAFQEVDFITQGGYAAFQIEQQISKADKDKCLEEMDTKMQTHYRMYQKFKKMLDDNNMALVTMTGKGQDPLAMIYDKTKYTCDKKSIKGCFKQTNKSGKTVSRGMEATFEKIGTKRKVKIVNLHLMFDFPPQKQIEEFQAQQIKDGIATVMVGDVNCSPNKATPGSNEPVLSSAIGDFGKPSNVDARQVDDRGINGLLSLKDNDDPTLNKTYDVGFASPPGRKGRVAVAETGMRYFEKSPDEEVQRFTQKLHNPKRAHPAFTGLPWKRTKHLLADLKKQYATEQNRKEKKWLLKKIVEVSASRMKDLQRQHAAALKEVNHDGVNLIKAEMKKVVDDLVNIDRNLPNHKKLKDWMNNEIKKIQQINT